MLKMARKLTAVVVLVTFLSSQIAYGAEPLAQYNQPIPTQTLAESVKTSSTTSPVTPTSLDFLAQAESPLQQATDASQPASSNSPPDVRVHQETTADGHTIFHVYEGESVQTAIDNAQTGDTVLLEAGIYHDHVILKAGINLKGVDAETTILHGDYQSGQHVIRALGNNLIEGLTISGGGEYAGMPSSAIKVEGDNVRIRNNRITDNKNYGIFVAVEGSTLIEKNLFLNTYLGVQLPKDGTVIRYNTFVRSSIAINILGGKRPTVTNNIITDSSFSSIYEFGWGMNPTRGYAVVSNNTFFNNREQGSYYGSATPPQVEARANGNAVTNPGFIDVVHNDFHIAETSAAYGRGAFLPDALSKALDRASAVNITATFETILNSGTITGYRIVYAAGFSEEFLTDGTTHLDTAPPSGTISINGGAEYTNLHDVTVNLTATDAMSGIDAVRFSTDAGVTWTAWEAFSASKNIQLPAVDGTKEIRFEIRDKVGNQESVSASIVLDTVAPTSNIQINNGQEFTNSLDVELTHILSACPTGTSIPAMLCVMLNNVRRREAFEITYSLDEGKIWSVWEEFSGTKSIRLPPEDDGVREIRFKVRDRAGNVSEMMSDTVTLDTTPPAGTILINGGAPYTVISDVSLTLAVSDAVSGLDQMRFSTDVGTTWSAWESFSASKNLQLPAGDGTKEVHFELRDRAGNVASLSDTITYTQNPILSDGTQLFYENGILVRELAPSGDEIFYRADGSVERYRYANGGNQIWYKNDANHTIEIFKWTLIGEWILLESIDRTVPTPLDENQALRVTLEDGLEAYYVAGRLVELRTVTGIRITDFTLTDAKDIQNAIISYPDGTLEVVRNGVVLRRIAPDGTILDLTPKGFVVREIQRVPGAAPLVQYYAYDKISQTQVNGLRIFTLDGTFSRYDSLGLLSESRDAGHHFVYRRGNLTDPIVTRLDLTLSTTPASETPMEFEYSTAGELKHMRLQNGTNLFFENGRLKRMVDAAGNETQYAISGTSTNVAGLQINHAGTQLQYNATGFLSKIGTSQGTIQRLQSDTNHDGKIDDQDIIQLLLETVGGDQLSDFEFDEDGKLLHGIITTREGIKQRIENGILTGFETVDGRIYTVSDHSATLQEWHFQDGKRVIYGGGTITEILFPEVGHRLNTISFNDKKEIVSYTEEIPDATDPKKITKKIFENNKLVTQIAPNKTEIHYGADGLAAWIILPDKSKQTITYIRDSADAIVEIVFDGTEITVSRPNGVPVHRVFKPEGTLVSILTGGVSAEVTHGEVSRLFTRFGSAENPTFDAQGVVSSDFVFVDGSRIKVINGELVQAIRLSGTIINYVNGKISSVVSGGTTFSLVYQEAAGELTGIQLQISGQVSTLPLVPYLLEHADSELSEIILPRPLFDSLANRFEIQSELSTGDSLFFAKLVSDPQRDSAYQLFGTYFPEWTNVNLNPTNMNQGYISWNQVRNAWNDLPALNSDLVDINGDGLPDRVYMDSALSNFWWVQLNTGQGFAMPVQWTGLDINYDSSTSGPRDAIRHYVDGGHPSVLGDLIDMNGDKLPDRVLQRHDGSANWYIQFNNGHGFDPTVVWGNVQSVQQYSSQSAYASEVRDDQGGKEVQELIADLVDLDGDGLPDRVIRPYVAPFDHWFFQKNLGNGFADAVLWEGIDTSFSADSKMGSSLSWYSTAANNNAAEVEFNSWSGYEDWGTTIPGGCRLDGNGDCGPLYAWGSYFSRSRTEVVGDQSDLVDMNGDGLPDRVLLRNEILADPSSSMDWYVQFNNGHGFDAAVLWDSDVRILPEAPNGKMGTSLRVFYGWHIWRQVLADIQDVNGDGLPDRITTTRNGNSIQATWWVEINTGTTFAPAVQWTGIYGANSTETAIGQDNQNFRSWPTGNSSASYVKQVTQLVDINGDKILDRIVFNQSQNKWLVQYGTGHGFLPVQEMKIEVLEAPANQVNTTRYDYLHVSVKSASNIPASIGSVRVTLGDPAKPESYQTWTITDLTTDWQDLYLPLDKTKADADAIKVEFLPAAGQNPNIPVYIDNVTFTALRPPAAKDWLDRLLAEENVISEIHSESTQTLAQYLGLIQSGEVGTSSLTSSFVNQLLHAETRIDFNAQGQVDQFQTLYGTVSQVENGQVTESTMPDGTTITFDPTNAANPQTTTQTVTSSGTAQTFQLSYGRVRTVARPPKILTDGTQVVQSPLQYTYEFCSGSQALWCAQIPLGSELVVVTDPDSGVVEYYLGMASGTELVFRSEANGVQKRFTRNEKGELVKTEVFYKGLFQQSFIHATTTSGNSVIVTDAGIREEYGTGGKIIAHITQDGFHYVHGESHEDALEFSMESVPLIPTEGLLKELYDRDPQSVLKYFAVDGVVPSTLPEFLEPHLLLVPDPEGRLLHEVVLDERQFPDGETAYYGRKDVFGNWIRATFGELTSVVLADKTRIQFETVEKKETTDPETGNKTTEKIVKSVLVFYPDGTITEFRNGLPYSVTSATGHTISLVTENGSLINPSNSAVFHLEQAQKLWRDLVMVQWNDHQLVATQLVAAEQNPDDGKIISRFFAEGTVELYNEQGLLERILGPTGEILALYQYDASGNPTGIDMSASRRRLEMVVSGIRAEIVAESEEALAQALVRKQVLDQTLEGEYQIIVVRLEAIRAQIQASRNQLASIKVKGKRAKSMMSDAYGQIDVAEAQLNGAIQEAARKREEALKSIATQYASLTADITLKTNQAYSDLAVQEQQGKESILKQEALPVIQYWYRKILGRDASRSEYEQILGLRSSAGVASYLEVSGKFNGIRFIADIQGEAFRAEREARQKEVQDIKTAVISVLQNLASLSEVEQKTKCLDEYGIEAAYCLPLSLQNVHDMESWINQQGMHFGQSAFIVLEELLKDIPPDPLTGKPSRVALATQLIVTDILTGTLTPFEAGDLVISMDAMTRYAKIHKPDQAASIGELSAYKMDYDALKALYLKTCPSGALTPCSFEAMVQVSGNHYVIVTGFREVRDGSGKLIREEVMFKDPGAGQNGFTEEAVLTKEAFLVRWTNSSAQMTSSQNNSANEFGYVLLRSEKATNLSGTHYAQLTAREAMSVRGAFFIIDDLIIAICLVIVAVIQAVAAAIAAIVTAIIAAISSMLAGIGGMLTSLAAGNFMAAGQALFGGLVNGLMALGTGFVEAAQVFGSGMMQAFSLAKGAMGLAFQSGFMKVSMIGLSLDGAGRLLDAVGVSPRITQPLMSVGRLAIGVGLLATGDPMGVSFIAGGTADLLGQYTNLPPLATNLIAIGASALGSFAVGGFDTGSLAGAISGFKSSLPFLSMDLASAGLVGLGNALNLSPMLTSLINIPVRAAVGSVAGKFSGVVTGYRDDGTPIYVSNPYDRGSVLEVARGAVFNPNAVAGMISVGANVGLETIGTPPLARDFVNGFISSFGQTATGQAIFSKLGEGLSRFTGWVTSGVSSVVNFGTKILNGATHITETGFRKGIDSFAGIFSRETQENLYADQTGLRSGTVTVSGDVWTWQNGSSQIVYNSVTGQLTESSGAGGTARIDNLGKDSSGHYYYDTLNYQTITSDGTLTQIYDHGALSEWSYQYKDGTQILAELDKSARQNPQTLFNGGIENGKITINIPGPKPDSNFQHNPITTPEQYDWTTLDLYINSGSITNAYVEYKTSQGSSAIVDNTTSDEALYTLVNGITNSELFSAPGYLFNMKEDIVEQSNEQVAMDDIILAPTFFSSRLLAAWNAYEMIKNFVKINPIGLVASAIFDEAIDKLVNLVKDSALWVSEMYDSSTSGVISTDIRNGLEKYFFNHENDRSREMVGVGYSGGFLPLGELFINNAYAAETDTGYNATSLVGLGGVNVQLQGPYQKVLDGIVGIGEMLVKASAKTAEFLSNIRARLNALVSLATGAGGLITLNQAEADQVYQTLEQGTVDGAYQVFINIANDKMRLWQAFEPALNRPSNIGVVVNVYGDKDVLTDLHIGNQAISLTGYRESIGQYTPDDRNKALVNIEIKGATHYDYVRSDPEFAWWKGVVSGVADTVDWLMSAEDREWNKTVSDFCADLIGHSKSLDDLKAFLDKEAIDKHGATIEETDGLFVIKLPGYDNR